jgi:hypothetical protein
LAEGQKSAEVKHDWGVATPFRQPRQLAERVEFPEKNADFRFFETSFGGGGQISREKGKFTVKPVVIWRSGSPVGLLPGSIGILNVASLPTASSKTRRKLKKSQEFISCQF